jgi:hypothetical protein
MRQGCFDDSRHTFIISTESKMGTLRACGLCSPVRGQASKDMIISKRLVKINAALKGAVIAPPNNPFSVIVS